MTVLIDTYEVPAASIILQLYKTACYEIFLEEVYSKSYNAPREGKKYIILEDINAKTLLSMRDTENIIYVIHQEMLTKREYQIIHHYTNELICIEGSTIRVTNKRNRRCELYKIERRKIGPHQIMHMLSEITAEEKKPFSLTMQINEEQQQAKNACLPYLQVQRNESVYFPDENSGEEDDDLESDCS